MNAFGGYDSRSIADSILCLSRATGKPVTPMQLLKLEYICHGWMLGLHGRPLTNEGAEAWKYGPVLPTVYHDFKRYGGGSITELPDCADPLDPEAQSVISQVWDGYSKYDGIQLSALTHKPGTPWDVTRRTLGIGAVISNDLIRDHYRTLARKQA